MIIKTLIPLALSVWLFIYGDPDTVKNDANSTQIEDKSEIIEVSTIKADKKKLPKYTAEEILCSLADTAWDNDAHMKVIKSLTDVDIRLTGTVSRVRNNMDGCYIVFTQKRADGMRDGWAVITCYFSDKNQIEQVMKLEKGDIVTLEGHSSKYPITGISMNDCKLK